MNKTKRFLFVFTAMLMILSFGFSAIAAVTSTAYYNVTSESEIIPFSNSNNYNMYGKFNTTPSVGNGGVWIKVYKSDGTYVTSKLFPKQTTVSNLQVTFQSQMHYSIRVCPNTAGQNVRGYVNYTISTDP